MVIVLIGCIASNRVIGRGGTIPWDLPEDRKRFRELTWGKGIVMGMHTYRSIGHPLEGRFNIVLSRGTARDETDLHLCRDIPAVLDLGLKEGMEELWIIGGGEVYAEFLPLAVRMELTLLNQPFEGDVLFPRWDEKDWEVVKRCRGPRAAGDPLEHEYLSMRRIRPVPRGVNLIREDG
ncbi:MAG: dihydrofolate reductase [Spirochaetales bacterium]